MNKKLKILSLCSFIIALAIYIFSYTLFHYLSPTGGFTPVYQSLPVKPFVTLLFGILGVCFHFASVMSFMIAVIFFPNKKS